jgi:LysM repeat protein
LATFFLLITIVATFYAAPVAAQEGVVVHTVQPGETLSEIAAQYAVTAEEILALNDLDDPDAIVAGQQLRIPAQFTDRRLKACTGSNRARRSPASPPAMTWPLAN